MTALSVTVTDGPSATTLTVGGEIDIANADEFGRELAKAAETTDAGLVLDLTAVTYLDSAGLGELFGLASRMAERGAAVAIVVPMESPLRRLFRIVELEEVASLVDTHEAAARVATGS